MDNKDISKYQSENSLNESMNSPLKEELYKILEELNIQGEISDNSHPLVIFMEKNRNKIKKSRIKYSYTNEQTIWREFKVEDKIYLFRITNIINNNIKDLIKNEFKHHEECTDLDKISIKFICYYLSDYLNFSVFITEDYYTLEEILTKKKLPSLCGDKDLIEFSINELFKSVFQTIKNLNIKKHYYICPFITPSNLLYSESTGKEFFIFTEIFLKVDSNEKEIEIDLNNKKVKEWLSSEFVKNKAKLSFLSNISCLGNLFFKIAFSENPKKPINVDKDSIFKELIDSCIEIDIKKRWKFDEIEKYLDENDFEEKKKEESNKLKKELIDIINKDNNLNDYIINNPEKENQQNKGEKETNDFKNKQNFVESNSRTEQNEEKIENRNKPGFKIEERKINNNNNVNDKTILNDKDEKNKKNLEENIEINELKNSQMGSEIIDEQHLEKEKRMQIKTNLEKINNEIEINKKEIEMRDLKIKKDEEIYFIQKEEEIKRKIEEEKKIDDELKKLKEDIEKNDKEK